MQAGGERQDRTKGTKVKGKWGGTGQKKKCKGGTKLGRRCVVKRTGSGGTEGVGESGGGRGGQGRKRRRNGILWPDITWAKLACGMLNVQRDDLWLIIRFHGKFRREETTIELKERGDKTTGIGMRQDSNKDSLGSGLDPWLEPNYMQTKTTTKIKPKIKAKTKVKLDGD